MDENANIGDKKKTEVFFKVANDGKWKVNSPVTCVVTRIIKDTEGHNALEAGESALSGIDKAKEFLDKLTVGQKLKIKMTIKTDDNETPDIKEMIGGNSLLMKDGELMDCNFNDSYNNVLYPRTGVGCSKDGRWLYMMAIDGRQSHSRGVYTDEMCDLFRSIGASDVVGFDGGGSTEMVVNHKLVNKPSDGRERAVTDGWLLQTSAPVDNDIVRTLDGDRLMLMLSDGIVQSYDEVPWLCEMLSRESTEDPAKLTEKILAKAKKMNLRDDDMTCVAVKVAP